MITSLKVKQKSDAIKISDKLLSNAIDAIAQKAKNVSFGCYMEMYFFHRMNLKKRTM